MEAGQPGRLDDLLVADGEIGELTIRGEAGRREIDAMATVCASDEELLEKSQFLVSSVPGIH